jgi:hypothetical protein
VSILSKIHHLARYPGDPKVLEAGPSAAPAADRVAKGLGWFSLALGAVEIAAPSLLTRALGMEGREGLVRACGVREVAAGVTSLSPEKSLGLWSRVGGDLMDLAVLWSAYRDDNPKRDNVAIALAAVAGIACLDLVAAKATTTVHARARRGPPRDYSHRSGWPRGLAASRGSGRRDSSAGALAVSPG